MFIADIYIVNKYNFKTMGKYLKKFSTDSERVEYEDSENYLEPYVSYVDGDNTVHYNKEVVETRLIATYNVEDASNPTLLYAYYAEEGEEEYWVKGVDVFSKVEIDGTEVAVADLDTAQGQYQLSAGEHTVKYTLKGKTLIDGAFTTCPITSVEIPNSVTSIGQYAFNLCESLTSVTIGSGVTSIGDDAFASCESLASIVVDSNNTVYDSRGNCNAIIETATNTLISGCKNTVIPNSVTSIGNSAFNECIGLTSATIPNGVTSIGDGAFAYCKGLTSVAIGNGVTSIGTNAFEGCASLTSVIIGSGVTNIGSSAFAYCEGLTSITIPSGVTSISDGTFYNCISLTSVTIPNSVASIGDNVFMNCRSLTSVTVESVIPPTLGYAAFGNNGIGRKIYVPSESVEAYKAASGWNTYAADIEPTT